MSQLANPAELDRAAAQLQQGITELERIQRTVQAAMNRTDWQGIAGDSLRTEILAVQKQIDTARRELHAMAILLQGGADSVRSQRTAGQQARYVGQLGAAATQAARWLEPAKPVVHVGQAGVALEQTGKLAETTAVSQAGTAITEVARRTETVDLGQAGQALTQRTV